MNKYAAFAIMALLATSCVAGLAQAELNEKDFIGYRVPAPANTPITVKLTHPVLVRQLADINHDGIIDLLDMRLVGRCFQSEDALCLAACDLNLDGKVNILDMATIGINYGKQSIWRFV